MGTPSRNTITGLQQDIDQLEDAGMTVIGARDIAAARVDVLTWLDEIGIGIAADDTAEDTHAYLPVPRVA